MAAAAFVAEALQLFDAASLWGFPCCARFPCVRAAASTPVQRLGVVFAHLTQPYQPSPKLQSGRPAHRNYRNGGTDYRPKGDPRRVKVHDFEDKELGKVTPYGVYDVGAKAISPERL